MKKLLVLIPLLFGLSAIAQTPYNPGRTIIESSATVDVVTDATYKFVFPNGADIWTIGIGCTDTIEPSDTLYARLYGGIDGATWYPISDTIQLDSANFPCKDYWTGTNFPWPFGKIEVDRDTNTTDGDYYLILWYKQ